MTYIKITMPVTVTVTDLSYSLNVTVTVVESAFVIKQSDRLTKKISPKNGWQIPDSKVTVTDSPYTCLCQKLKWRCQWQYKNKNTSHNDTSRKYLIPMFLKILKNKVTATEKKFDKKSIT